MRYPKKRMDGDEKKIDQQKSSKGKLAKEKVCGNGRQQKNKKRVEKRVENISSIV